MCSTKYDSQSLDFQRRLGFQRFQVLMKKYKNLFFIVIVRSVSRLLPM